LPEKSVCGERGGGGYDCKGGKGREVAKEKGQGKVFRICAMLVCEEKHLSQGKRVVPGGGREGQNVK